MWARKEGSDREGGEGEERKEGRKEWRDRGKDKEKVLGGRVTSGLSPSRACPDTPQATLAETSQRRTQGNKLLCNAALPWASCPHSGEFCAGLWDALWQKWSWWVTLPTICAGQPLLYWLWTCPWVCPSQHDTSTWAVTHWNVSSWNTAAAGEEGHWTPGDTEATRLPRGPAAPVCKQAHARPAREPSHPQTREECQRLLFEVTMCLVSVTQQETSDTIWKDQTRGLKLSH